MSDPTRDNKRTSGDPSEGPLLPVDRRLVILGTSFVFSGYLGLGGNEASASTAPDREPTKKGDRFQITSGELKDEFVKPDLLEVGASPLQGFPYNPEAQVLKRKNRLNRVLFLRLDPDRLDEETLGRSIDGVVVFSALCTHRACTIKSWMEEEGNLRCHCHLSEFSAISGGSVERGPAHRSLPMVPIALDDEGFIVATDGFTGRVGPSKK